LKTGAFVCALLAVAVGCSSRQHSQSVVPQSDQRHVMSVPGSTYDSAVLALSPYAYYRLDETSGTTAADASGHGRNGTYEGTPGTHYTLGQTSIVPGTSYTAKFFAANPGAPKVALPSVPFGLINGSWAGDFTVTLWAKPDSSAVSQAGGMIEVNDYYVGQLSPSITPSTSPYFGAYPIANWFSSSGTFADGNAHMLALVVKHSTTSTKCDLFLYVDGALNNSAGSTTCAGGNETYSTNAGVAGRVSYASGAGGYFGQVGGVAIFSGALSASQIAGLYNPGPTPTPSPSPTPSPAPTPLPGVYDANVLTLAPYAYYRLDETGGTVAKDATGNGHDGTYQGTPGTHYLLGQGSIVPGLTTSLKTYGVNPGTPIVTLPSVPFGMSGGVWQNDFSVTLWMKPDPSQLSQSAAAAEINDYYVGEGGANGSAATTAYMGVMPVANWWSSSATYADGNAHMVTLTIHRNASGTCDLAYYIDNGNLVANPTGTTCSGNSSIQTATNAGISGRVSYAAGAAPLFGEIGGVAIWDHPLTPAEIGNLYAGTPAHR
jgi:Concanavalin A-like lectin/glucanases superfamily